MKKFFNLLRLWVAYWVLPKNSREALKRLAEGSQAINPKWTADDVLEELKKTQCTPLSRRVSK